MPRKGVLNRKNIGRVCAHSLECCVLLVNVQAIGVLCIGCLVYVIPTIRSCSTTCCVMALVQHNMFSVVDNKKYVWYVCKKKEIDPKLDSKSVPSACLTQWAGQKCSVGVNSILGDSPFDSNNKTSRISNAKVTLLLSFLGYAITYSGV